MEVRNNTESNEMLQGPWAMCAGGASLAVAAVAGVLLVKNIPGDGERFSVAMIWFALSIGLSSGVAI
ncbi:MAG: hypothetical protein QGG25_19145, partial [Phycisphaerae bacterium]|nr:hypothetical protein [Phycisphaerae bacterium]